MLAALVIGIMGSLHCVGMCGPLVMAMPFGSETGRMPATRLIGYHSGRMATYAGLGILMGLIGGGLRYFFVQQWISIASGVLLLLFYFLPMALPAAAKPSWTSAWNRQVVGRLRKLLQPVDGTPGGVHFFSLGLLNGLLPCGLVYMALIGAIAQPTVWEAALFMAVFGLGTSPALTAVIFANKVLAGKVKSSFSKAIPFFVVIVAALLILRGMGLGIPFISPADEQNCCHGPEAAITRPYECVHPSLNQYDELSNTTSIQDQFQL